MSQCFAIKHLETQFYQIFDCFQVGKKYIMTGWNRSTYTNCICLFFPTSKKVPLLIHGLSKISDKIVNSRYYQKALTIRHKT